MKIGIFDSGIGGLHLLKTLYQICPDLHYTYLADWAYQPYGLRQEVEIQDRVEKILNWLRQKTCDLGMVACYSASSAISSMETRFQTIMPFLTMIPAATQSLASSLDQSDFVGIMATPLSLQSGLDKKIQKQWPIGDVGISKSPTFIGIPCPELVALIEQGRMKNAAQIAHQNLEKATKNLSSSPNILYGCTHFPWIHKELSKLSSLNFIDAAEILGKTLKAWRKTHPQQSSPGKIDVFFSRPKDFYPKFEDYWKKWQSLWDSADSIPSITSFQEAPDFITLS